MRNVLRADSLAENGTNESVFAELDKVTLLSNDADFCQLIIIFEQHVPPFLFKLKECQSSF